MHSASVTQFCAVLLEQCSLLRGVLDAMPRGLPIKAACDQIGESMPGQGVFLIKSHVCKRAFQQLFCTFSCRNPPLMMLLVQLSRACAKSVRIAQTFNVWARVRVAAFVVFKPG